MATNRKHKNVDTYSSRNLPPLDKRIPMPQVRPPKGAAKGSNDKTNGKFIKGKGEGGS